MLNDQNPVQFKACLLRACLDSILGNTPFHEKSLRFCLLNITGHVTPRNMSLQGLYPCKHPQQSSQQPSCRPLQGPMIRWSAMTFRQILSACKLQAEPQPFAPGQLRRVGLSLIRWGFFGARHI